MLLPSGNNIITIIIITLITMLYSHDCKLFLVYYSEDSGSARPTPVDGKFTISYTHNYISWMISQHFKFFYFSCFVNSNIIIIIINCNSNCNCNCTILYILITVTILSYYEPHTLQPNSECTASWLPIFLLYKLYQES